MHTIESLYLKEPPTISLQIFDMHCRSAGLSEEAEREKFTPE